jgi:hypothetical protein
MHVGLLRTDGRERLVGRIVFPEIRQNQTVWLIGRQLESTEDEPRYLGSRGPKPPQAAWRCVGLA